MKLRSYEITDAEEICSWIEDKRTHAMWCAGRFPFPLGPEDFERCRLEGVKQWSDRCFTAIDEGGALSGYFALSMKEERSAFLKYLIIHPQRRGQGLGGRLLAQIREYVFLTQGMERLRLVVFDCNTKAWKCYKRAGFSIMEYQQEAFRYEDQEAWGRYLMECRAEHIASLETEW